jgi:16S rRNA (adenine1518-N6/adenine1519-N6)-dimethyltransferase
MMQKEVAQRATALPGSSERGSLSVFLQARFSIRKVADAPKGAFHPPPRVDSVVLELTPSLGQLSEAEEASFDRFVRSAFRMPRKTLANNLAALAGSREAALDWLQSQGLHERARPSVPNVEQWIGLWRRSKSK